MFLMQQLSDRNFTVNENIKQCSQ